MNYIKPKNLVNRFSPLTEKIFQIETERKSKENQDQPKNQLVPIMLAVVFFNVHH